MDSTPQQSATSNQPPQEQVFYRKRKWLRWGLVYFAIALAMVTIAFGIFYASLILKVLSSSPYSPPPPARVTQPIPTPTDETANWKTYTYFNGFTLKYPSNWKQKPLQPLGSGISLDIEDPMGIYTLNFTRRGNYNNGTGKQFTSLDEYVNMPYKMKTVIVDGQEGIQPLPRAGAENVNLIYFFSKDAKFIYSIELTTLLLNEINIQEGQRLFDQIISTFKFTREAPMEVMPATKSCDLDNNGKCDQTDFALFKKALGKKRGDFSYNPLADADFDGVVTSVDGEMLQFPFPITLPKNTPTPDQVACTQDAKLCPDGSYVGRQPPDCEFAPCP